MKKFAIDLEGKNFEHVLSASHDAERSLIDIVTFRNVLNCERVFVSESKFSGRKAKLYKLNCEVFLTVYEDTEPNTE